MWWVLISIAAVLVVAWLTHDSGSLDYRRREIDAAIESRRRAQRAGRKTARPQRSAAPAPRRHVPMIRPATVYR